MTLTTINNLIVTGVCGLAGYVYWPWDWRGRRRVVTLKRDRRPYE